MKTARHTFYRLFYKRELRPLLGKRQSNLLILALMLFITFTVIGFAEGSLRYLEQKMKDPFINWVNVIPGGISSWGMERIIHELNSEEARKTFDLNNAIGYNRFQLNFYGWDDIMRYYNSGDLDTNRISGVAARTLDLEDPVIGEIFSRKNHYSGTPYYGPMDMGLIVTVDMLQRLNYPLNTPLVWMDFPAIQSGSVNETIRVAIPVEVRGVVQALPGLAGFASTSYFFQQRTMHVGRNPFNPTNDNRLVLMYFGSATEAEALASAWETQLKECGTINGFAANRVWTESRDRSDLPGYQLLFATFQPRGIASDVLDRFFLQTYNSQALSAFRNSLFRTYDHENRFSSMVQAGTYDRIAVNFINLDKLRAFSIMLNETYQVEIDMAQVESRENYHFVSRLTGIISMVLIAFSILSVLLFVVHLLKKHLEGIKRNLGTFKAFGLSNKLMINIYVQIVLSILALAALLGLAASALFGYLGGMRLVLMLFATQFEAGNYFSLFSQYLLIAVVMLVVCSIFVLRFTTRKLLSKSPGDLIYERQ